MKWRLYREKLLWLRLNKGWSQEEAAFQCDAADKKQYHLWETGKTERPRKHSLTGICAAFELGSPDEIILSPQQQPAPELTIFYNAHFGKKAEMHFTHDQHNDLPFKLICFDLDATLIHGLDFSWKAVWNTLGDTDQQRKQGLRLYHSGNLGYEEWCHWCCKILQQKGLNKNTLEGIARQFKAAPQLQQGLKQLKQQGFKLAIISGGIFCFLEQLIPNHAELFDYTFINKFHFDKQGKLQYIQPTPFDFDTKPEGIRYICSAEGFSPQQTIFVGSTFVDKFVINAAGYSIGYANPSDEIRELFDQSLIGNDFSLVVNAISDLNAKTQAV